jgi:putative glutamine amidotransferase
MRLGRYETLRPIASGGMATVHLARALGADHLMTNSFHHQALARVASGLCVTARATDGIIEGAESADPNWWMLAVQWHPEELMNTPDPWDRNLLGAFARELDG